MQQMEDDNGLDPEQPSATTSSAGARPQALTHEPNTRPQVAWWSSGVAAESPRDSVLPATATPSDRLFSVFVDEQNGVLCRIFSTTFMSAHNHRQYRLRLESTELSPPLKQRIRKILSGHPTAISEYVPAISCSDPKSPLDIEDLANSGFASRTILKRSPPPCEIKNAGPLSPGPWPIPPLLESY
jgi:hypothetical protein